MSVIFRALEKLKSDTLEEEKREQSARKSRNVISWDSFARVIPRILIIGLLITAVGAAFYYGTRYYVTETKENIEDVALKRRASASPANVATEENSPDSRVDNLGSSETELPRQPATSKDIAAPHAHEPNVQASLPRPETSVPKPETSVPEKAAFVQEPAGPRFLPPQSEVKSESPSVSSAQKSTVISGSDLVLPEFIETKSSNSKSTAASKQIELSEGSVSASFLPPQSKTKAEGSQISNPVTAPKKDIFKERVPFANKGHLSSEMADSDARSAYFAPADARKRSVFHETTESVATETLETKAEKSRIASVKKNAKICRLVSETQNALLSEDDSRADALLKKLVSYKGSQNDYVMSLKAFLYLKQGEYESAASLLNILLQKDENDLEVGINMAVLEIKTGRLDQAQARLERLRQMYEGNAQIPILLEKIRR